ncbi:MAG: DNA-directed RNA polymerase subunit omega [Candidatus Zapsychrus exili]|nr:DNA-directed RNA polymerase subunit omega [Candidatus Zapsychrus exili]
MEYQSLENILPKAGGSTYRLVRLASARALELSEGRKSLVETTPTEALTTIALREICEGKVVEKSSLDALATQEPEESKPEE